MKRLTHAEDLREIIGDPQEIHDDFREFDKSAALFSTSRYHRLLEKYPDKWIAVTAGKVEAHGDSYEAVLQTVRERGLPINWTIIEFIETDPITMIL